MNALSLVQDPDRSAEEKPCIAIRSPKAEDGAAISHLIGRCPPLDRNSLYSTLLLCTHFADTCVLAEEAVRPCGWMSAYVRPERADTLFIWQIAIAPNHRGLGLATRLISAVLARPACRRICRLQTTITTDNRASWALFRGIATKLGADFHSKPHFLREKHFAGDHETEHLVTMSASKFLARSGT